jgi:hypothetical protein
MNDMCEAIEDFDEVEKLGQGFSSADPLEEIYIGDGITPRPAFVNKNMSLEHRDAIINLFRDYVDCFAWNYQIGFKPYKQPTRRFNLTIHDRLRRRWNDCST